MPRVVIVCGATFAIALAIAVSFPLAKNEARGQTPVSVDVGDRYFCNSSFMGGICETNISVGDTVTWTWVVASIHTVTQCGTGFTLPCPPAGGFYSDVLGNGATFSHTFNTAGSFDYRCDLHSTEMRGRVNVAAAQATPTASASPAAPAQTGAAGPASGAPAVSQTGAAVAIPNGGGAPADGGSSSPLVVAIAGGALLLLASAAAGVGALRR